MEYYVKSVVPIIESNYDKFTTVERNIADFFIQNRKKVDFSSKSIFRETLRIRSVRYPDLRRNADIADTENSSISMKRRL